MTLPYRIIGILLLSVLVSCNVGFKGISIPPDVKTFSVETFSLANNEAPVDLNLNMTEDLRRKIRQESRLSENNENPDVIFSGRITNYYINYVAPDENNTTSLNRLTISIKITYENTLNEEDNWEKSYSDFEDFDGNANFENLRDALIESISEDILERIFNDAFTDW